MYDIECQGYEQRKEKFYERILMNALSLRRYQSEELNLGIGFFYYRFIL